MGHVSTKQDSHYRGFCSDIARRYEDWGKWSQLELDTKKYIEALGFIERQTFWHNFKIQNADQTGFYILDLYLPGVGLNIECDGEPWHKQMGDADIKDFRRDIWLRFLGIKTIRIGNIEELKEALNGD